MLSTYVFSTVTDSKYSMGGAGEQWREDRAVHSRLCASNLPLSTFTSYVFIVVSHAGRTKYLKQLCNALTLCSRCVTC